jgi:ubiquinol-cytochrome c reductase cytochrome b subunit
VDLGHRADLLPALQIVTGIVLAMHYTAHVDYAFASVEHIMRNVNGGHMLRYLHQNGASLFFVAVYLHIFRGLYYGSYKEPREVTWIIGMLIYLAMMATAFMGYVLPWGQMSFWGATVITGLFGAIPFVGDSIQTWLLGGPAVDNATLNRFFSLHYLLPFVIAGLVIVHIWAFHTTGNNNPTGVEVRRTLEGRSRARHAAVLALLRDQGPVRAGGDPAVFFAIVGFMPNYLGHPDNYIEANPLVTPAHIVPEWYFLPFYAILRAFTADVWVVQLTSFITGGIIDAKFFGVLAMFGSIDRDGAGAVARHLVGPVGPLPPDVQVVVLAAGRRLLRADVGRRHAGRRHLHLDRADRLDLLVRLLPGDPAALWA